MADVLNSPMASSKHSRSPSQSGTSFGPIDEDKVNSDDLSGSVLARLSLEHKELDPQLVEWFKSRVTLPGYTKSMWLDDHSSHAAEFVHSAHVTKMLLEVDQHSLVIHVLGPHLPSLDRNRPLMYFVKGDDQKTITPQNVNEVVQYGVISSVESKGMDRKAAIDARARGVDGRARALNSLLKVMKGVYVPTFLSNESWPESVRKEFSGQLHKFMASLTETTHQFKGHTVLYVPDEDLDDVEAAAQDKDLLQRLESTLIHWTHQIKEVVTNPETSHQMDNSGPLEEIEFWQSRTVDLSGIQQQLGRPEVQRIVQILEQAGSTYLDPFRTPAEKIEKGSVEAQINLKFLQTLQEPCEKIAKSEPKKIPPELPNVLHLIRMIWTLCPYYHGAEGSERVQGLLRKVSNLIIKRCTRKIKGKKDDLSEIWDGDVQASIKALKESELCIQQWKEKYDVTVRVIKRNPRKDKATWDFDDASVFAQVEAFMQRCKDLEEVCTGQLQFARKTAKGKVAPPPSFVGSRGQEIESSLIEIEEAFAKHIEGLRHLEYDILDVTKTQWHDDFNKFKRGMTDLERMMKNIMESAFGGVSTVEHGVQLLHSFSLLAKRPSMRQNVRKKTEKLYKDFFAQEVQQTNKDFVRHRVKPPLPADHPKFAGAAMWAMGLMARIERSKAVLDNATFLEHTQEATDAMQQYADLHTKLETYMRDQHKNWTNSLVKEDKTSLSQRLERPLLNTKGLPPAVKVPETREEKELAMQREREEKSRHENGEWDPLESNFDRDLLRLFNEVHFWEKVRGDFTIPYAALEMNAKVEPLRVVRESVMLLVRDYNTIVDALTSALDKSLFHFHLVDVYNHIYPGLHQLSWDNRHVKEFVRSRRESCQKLYKILMKFKENDQAIKRSCETMETTLLFDITKNMIYSHADFSARQERHQAQVRKKLREAHEAIVNALNASFKFFVDPEDDKDSRRARDAVYQARRHRILRAWKHYVLKIDREVEKALLSSTRRSMIELAHSMGVTDQDKSGNADKHGSGFIVAESVHPMFRVDLILNERVKRNASRVEFRPSLDQLNEVLKVVSVKGTKCLEVVPRLVHTLESMKEAVDKTKVTDLTAGDQERKGTADDTQSLPPVHERVLEDTKILLWFQGVTSATNSIAAEMSKVIATFEEKYRKDVWHSHKDATIDRVKKSLDQRSPLTWEVKIQGYSQIQKDVEAEPPFINVKFIRIDTKDLKSTLAGHCLQWQQKYLDALHDIFHDELHTLYQELESYTEQLRSKPTRVEELQSKRKLLAQLHREEPTFEKRRIDPVYAKYDSLQKFESQGVSFRSVSDEDKEMVERLRPSWESFKHLITSSVKVLLNTEQEMKKELEETVHRLNQDSTDMRLEFVENAPLTAPSPDAGDPDVSGAFNFINLFRNRIQQHKARLESLQGGLQEFKIPDGDAKDVSDTEKELIQLEKVWRLMREWLSSWEKWKLGRFSDLDPANLERKAGAFWKQAGGFPRQVKTQWKVWQALSERIQRFRTTMPVIQDLRNPAMRPRHWQQLKEEIQREFDPEAASFTMEKLFELGVHLHAEAISNLSSIANRELSVETGIREIEDLWQGMRLELVRHKERYWRVRKTDDLNDALEKDQMTLSTMKNSPLYLTFSSDIDRWVSALGQIADVLDILLQVQRQWMYLESIFMDSADIRKQLPAENSLFESVNDQWVGITEEFSKQQTVMDCLLPAKGGLFEKLTRMRDKLERIQHQLDQYLEKKRHIFPRFYFLSNDDLLEILGQTKDPSQVQKHIHKCFMGISQLELLPAQHGRAVLEVDGMHASDGEEVKLAYPVPVAGAVEDWLTDVESAMKETLKKLLQVALQSVVKSSHKNLQWIKSTVGQLVITAGQIGWTVECQRALIESHKNRKAMRHLKSKWNNYLHNLTQYVRGKLDPIDRKKLVALITVEVHARDVIDKLKSHAKQGTKSFEWVSQLRFSWEKSEYSDYGVCKAHQTNTHFEYGYEYQGNNGRLVITPLTDRCYMTLTTALHLCRGGNPQGPAGTGKTETVKDLGKALGKFVVVFNCSEKMLVDSLARHFSGLSQTGAWGCFDEFNRILIEVLSVVALQISCILSAVQARKDHFDFEGQNIALDRNVGIFITMNPGYAGRTELPDNLKSLFRPVAMMVPDSELIAEIILQAGGFKEAFALSKKIITIYKLMQEKLSKQDHYDYGLRAIKSVLMRASAIVRAAKDANPDEELILMRAIRDMNIGKLVAEDAVLFEGLLKDLFPNLLIPRQSSSDLTKAIEQQLRTRGLQVTQDVVAKIMQLYRTMNTRHGNMLVGHTMGGKTTAWNVLADALRQLAQDGVPGFHGVEVSILNPKSLLVDELYGNYDRNNEWQDGVLSSIMRKFAASNSPTAKWLMLDGPVDTLWIESMNTVLDDNKVLTLVNGDRIALTDQMSLLFEVQDLSVASPATVSRCGMVYFDADALGWTPFFESWLERRLQRTEQWARDSRGADVEIKHASSANTVGGDAETTMQEEVQHLRKLFDKYAVPLLAFRRENCKELVDTVDINAVQSLCRLYDALATPANGVSFGSEEKEEAQNTLRMSALWFVFCAIWSIGASVDEQGRHLIDRKIRDVEAQFPPLHTVYEYYVDVHKRDWILWDEKVNKQWRPAKDAPFYRILVPTMDTVRYSYILNELQKERTPILVVGSTGTGKTAIVQSLLDSLDQTRDIRAVDQFRDSEERDLTLTINFSSATTSALAQDMLESRLQKRQRTKYGPKHGRHRLIAFVDDLNMPAKDEYGSQPPVELLRQFLDYGFWYDRQKQFRKDIQDVQLIMAMGPPGGSRSELSERFQSRCHLVNFTFPEDMQIKRIFSTLVNDHLNAFDEEIKELGDVMVNATLDLYKMVSKQFLPTPAKSHYLFNMRDMARVFQGIRQSDSKYYDTDKSMIRLWVHECLRVFYDRLVDEEDQHHLLQLINTQLNHLFPYSWKKLFDDPHMEKMPMFGAFLDDGGMADDPEENHRPYQEIADEKVLLDTMRYKLEMYNMDPQNVPMDLVLFKAAIEHVSRIHRIISQPRGSALLIGVGGSGRRSLARLAAHMAEQTVFTINLKKGYTKADFLEDMKVLFRSTGIEQHPTMFLFSDGDLVDESILEVINNILTSGEIPHLFPADELGPMMEEIRADAQAERGTAGDVTADALYAYFIERVRDNTHLVLCMSPVGEFRDRIRMYPALVNNTSIDWFSDWDKAALLEVSSKFLASVELDDAKQRAAVAEVFTSVHTSVVSMSRKMLMEVRRTNYVTPTKYLDLVQGYRSLLSEKRASIQEASNKLQNGLQKLDQSKEAVSLLSKELQVTKIDVKQKKDETEKLQRGIAQQRRQADQQFKAVEKHSAKTQEESKEAEKLKADAQRELDKVGPAIAEALQKLDQLSKSAVAELQAYRKPPPAVEKVMAAVMTVLKKDTAWLSAKRELSSPSFLSTLKNFHKTFATEFKDQREVEKHTKDIDKMLRAVNKFTKHKDFNVAAVTKVSAAAGAMAAWIKAMEMYATAHRTAAPRKMALTDAEQRLDAKQAALQRAQKELEVVTQMVADLQEKYNRTDQERRKLEAEAKQLELKLRRAGQIVDGLSGERSRWEASVNEYKEDIKHLTGDCALAAAFLGYAGPFPSQYRQQLVQECWMPAVQKSMLPVSDNFNFAKFLAVPTDVREWNIQGLPSDDFSTENGVLVVRGNRYPLMIDPQGQASKWIQKKDAASKLQVVTTNQDQWLTVVQTAVQFGTPVLIKDVGETLPSALGPLLRLSRTTDEVVHSVKMGDKDLSFSPGFMLYLCTKHVNPHYKPEVCIQTTIVNFAVKEKGLEDQLLGLVVQLEEPQLEEEKGKLVLAVAQGKKQLVEKEDEILSLLKSAGPNLLDDEVLINTLQESRRTGEEIKRQLRTTEETEQQIDVARNHYRPAAHRAAIIYFVLNDLALVDPMYQFSLDSYVDLFRHSIESSRESKSNRREKASSIEQRNISINEYHTLAVYKHTTRALFERHKLLLAFQICVKKMQSDGQVDPLEYDFFLRGGTVLDRSQRPENPCKGWLSEVAWDNITELDKLKAFRGLASSFESNSDEWRDWYRSVDPPPEKQKPVGEWQNKWSDFQQMLVLRVLRPDRVLFAARAFIEANLGREFTEPPQFNLREVFEVSKPSTPLIFILAPGVDPTEAINQLAKEESQRRRAAAEADSKAKGQVFDAGPFSTHDELNVHVSHLPLGQGQTPIAEQLLKAGVKKGHWVFLANCHLSIRWMPTLEKLMEQFASDPNINVHPNFRLWLSSTPSKDFPISLLQKAIKMTTEPPRGLKANMQRLYGLMTEQRFNACSEQPAVYRKLLYSLVYFHATLVERRKFLTLGWNIPYAFNDSDFMVCENLLSLYLDEYKDSVPWDALKYLIAEANYGGRVTDDMDRRVLRVYIKQFFNEDAINTAHYQMAPPLDVFSMPADGTLDSYRKYVAGLPGAGQEPPEAFGQNANADLASQEKETYAMLDTILALQPRVAAQGAGVSREDTVLQQIDQLLAQLPEELPLSEIKDENKHDRSPLKTVLLQEVARYNALLRTIQQSLMQLHNGLKGLVVISPELEQVSESLFALKVPQLWQSAYPSLKPLGAWMEDLKKRIAQLRDWATKGTPKVFWLSGFTFPTGFLTAIMQTVARRNSVSIDGLQWEFTVLHQDEDSISSPPKEGAYIKGLFLEGARWDAANGYLADTLPMELHPPMPIVHFRPVEARKKALKGLFACPLYQYPVRAGTSGRPSFLLTVDLKGGAHEPDFWVKRGAALLLSLDK